MARTILVVEDDPTNRQVLSDYLGAKGYRVVLARDGNEGVQKFRDEHPDLALIDALLPAKNGFEVCFELRRTPRGKAMPILMMSAVCKDVHSAHHATHELGAQGYLVKPFKLHDLLRTITSLLGAA